MSKKTCKLITLGNAGVGKSTLLHHIAHNGFSELSSTTGVQMFVFEKVVNQEKIVLNMWDTAGQERFQNINKIYYKGANMVFIVYAGNSQESFRSIDHWLEDVKQNISPNTPVVLVCSKIDLGKVVNDEIVREMIQRFGFNGFFEVSAKTGEGIKELIENIFQMISLNKDIKHSASLERQEVEINNCKC
jgi:Ras-related protein Rab-1A